MHEYGSIMYGKFTHARTRHMTTSSCTNQTPLFPKMQTNFKSIQPNQYPKDHTHAPSPVPNPLKSRIRPPRLIAHVNLSDSPLAHMPNDAI